MFPQNMEENRTKGAGILTSSYETTFNSSATYISCTSLPVQLTMFCCWVSIIFVSVVPLMDLYLVGDGVTFRLLLELNSANSTFRMKTKLNMNVEVPLYHIALDICGSSGVAT